MRRCEAQSDHLAESIDGSDVPAGHGIRQCGACTQRACQGLLPGRAPASCTDGTS